MGALQRRSFNGLSAKEREFYERTSILPQRPDLEHDRASLWDREPPAVFLAAVGGDAAGCPSCQQPTPANTAFANNARAFYGGRGRATPGGGSLAPGVGWSEAVPEGETALIALAARPAHHSTA